MAISKVKVPPGGVWVPAVTFFNHDTDIIDIESREAYYSYLLKCGLAGLVILGTNSETFLLTREERKTLIQIARRACDPSYLSWPGWGDTLRNIFWNTSMTPGVPGRSGWCDRGQ
ncbi:hypothetical protein F5Y01DRAFT_284735 [Xylaria sp. FL0043]|nr:hypothetical protein F5Y01DRAFT_284735 [Xylaria sp. FL0043]